MLRGLPVLFCFFRHSSGSVVNANQRNERGHLNEATVIPWGVSNLWNGLWNGLMDWTGGMEYQLTKIAKLTIVAVVKLYRRRSNHASLKK